MDKFTLTLEVIAPSVDEAEEFAALVLDSAPDSIAVGTATLTKPDGTVDDLLDGVDNEIDEDDNDESDFIDDETGTADDPRQHIN